MLLSYAIAGEQSGSSYLFMCPTGGGRDAKRLLELLTADGTFEDHHVLESPTDDDGNNRSNWKRKRIIRRNIRRIRSFLESTDVDAVYSTLDDREIVQAAMHFASKYGTEPAGIHIEDGGNEYTDWLNTWSPYRSDLLNAVVNYLLFGFVWRNPTIYGTLDSVTEVYATFPEHLRPELAEKETTRIDPGALRELGRTTALRTYFRSTGASIEELKRLDAVVLVPYLFNDDTSAEYEMMETLIETIQSTNRTVGLKYHPRLAEADTPSFDADDTVEIPREIPLELVIISEDTSLDAVFGARSTGLKSTVWLSDAVSAVSLYPLIVDEDLRADDVLVPNLIDNYAKMGVGLIEDEADLTNPELMFDARR